jgi:signal transduction histidine kinase/tetratricopeptide (TPR) repeat protein
MRPADRGDRIVGRRFRLLHLIKAAQGIDTWFAEDLERPDPVSVKTIDDRAVPSSVKLRLEHEAAALRVLSGPHFAPPLAVGHDECLMYFAAPWVSGETLAERLSRRPLAARETLSLGRCLLAALVEVHQGGVIHGDIKPSNVVLDASAAHAVLIDFALARSALLDVAMRDLPACTVRYMSPEQTGRLDEIPDERSDLYSVGAVLFECLIGQPLCHGDTISEALREQLSERSTGRQRFAPSGPRALLEVVQHLLQEAPRNRYQSAAGALADLEQIERDLVRGVADPSLVVGLHDRRSTLAEPAFVGRERELAALEAHLERAARGKSALVLLEAESGLGKTRVLDELARRRVAGTWLLRGRGVVEMGAHPFRLLSGVVSDLVALARREPAMASALRKDLADQRDALCAVFPELTAVFGPVVVRESGPENLGEPRTLSAFAALLLALGTEARPALVLLDDCQWANDAVLKLLQTFQERRATSDRPCHVLVVASFRSEEVPEGHPLRRMAGAPVLALPPLDGAAVGRLLESMGGTLPGEAVSVGQQLSAGSPFMAAAVLQGMVECGALVAQDGSFRVEPSAIHDVRSSGEAAVFLLWRMERLPAHVLRLLSVGAVLGREFGVELAATLSGQSSAELLGALAEARRRYIVWIRDHGARLVFAHDKLREALLSRLSDDERRRLHLQAALRIEETDPGRSFEIAYHFDAAGVPQRALSYALAAGNEARSRHALDVAEQHYRIARRGAPEDDEAIRLRVAEGLGDVLMLRGRYGDAAHEFLEARRLARGDVDGARLEGKLGELAFKSGDVATAGWHVEQGLGLLGRRVPRRSAAVALLLGWEVLVQVLHTLLPRIFVGRRKLEGSGAEFLAVHLHSRLTHVYWFQRGNAATLWAHLREMNLAERYPPTLPLAQAYSEHAPVMTMIPWFSRGIAYARRSYQIRKALGDAWGQGQSLHFLGVVLYAASRFEESIESCSGAIRLLERTGDQWEVNTARWHIGYCHYRLGALRAAVNEAQRVFRAGAEIGDAQARGIGLAIWAKASSGRAPEGAIREELMQQSADVHTRAEVLQAEAVRLLAEGRTADAAVMLQEARHRVERAGLKQEYVAPVLPWLATALRRQLEEAPPHAPARRAALLREALPVARRAVRLARSYRNNLAHALRERALLLAMRGRPGKARRCLDESLASAERLGMGEEAARSRLARGRIGLLEGWAGAEEDIASAERTLQAMESELAVGTAAARDPVAEQFGVLLETGRRLASARRREEVFAAAREGAAALLGEERCLILEVSGAKVEPATEGDRGDFSQAVVRHVVSEGKLLAVEGEEPLPSQSPALGSVRSALCAPIQVRDRIAACLYVRRPRPDRLFGEIEKGLAEFVVSLAGAALENAEGFAAVQAHSEGLARRVEELSQEVRDTNLRKAEFIGVLSHEFRNPLAAICNSVYVLGRVPPGAAQATQALAVLERQVHQLRRLTDDLLDVARISRGKVRLLREVLELKELVRRTVEDQRQIFTNRGVELEVVDDDDEPLHVNADPTRLAQVVGNLLQNAAKFTPPGGRTTLSLERTDEDQVAITVRDTGTGIEPALLQRLFEPFVQAEETLARSTGGLGLGLALVKELIELHGGSVSAFSEGAGKGATFVVRLPIEQEEVSMLSIERPLCRSQDLG